MTRFQQLIQAATRDLRLPDRGPATTARIRAVHRTVLLLAASWQGLMAPAVLLTLGWSAWPLAALQAVLGAYALFAAGSPRREAKLVPAAMVLLGTLSQVAGSDIDSALALGARWQLTFAACAAGFLISERWVVPAGVASSLAVSGAVVVVRPEWGLGLPVALFVTRTRDRSRAADRHPPVPGVGARGGCQAGEA